MRNLYAKDFNHEVVKTEIIDNNLMRLELVYEPSELDDILDALVRLKIHF
jgi:hypothetical protein